MVFLAPGTLAALSCEPYAFLSNSFATLLLQNVSKFTLMSCCQIPSGGVSLQACSAGLVQAVLQALLGECWNADTLSWGPPSVPGICVFPQIQCERVVRKSKTICILLSVKKKLN